MQDERCRVSKSYTGKTWSITILNMLSSYLKDNSQFNTNLHDSLVNKDAFVFITNMWKTVTGHQDIEPLISEIVRTNKSLVGKVISCDEEYFIENHARIKLMNPLESLSFKENAKLSYPSYDRVKEWLDEAGYPVLHNSADIAHLNSILSTIVAQRLNFRLHKERKATALDFGLFFGQLNEYIDKLKFDTSVPEIDEEIENLGIDEFRKEMYNHLRFVFRTDG
mmetsp:Transcript_18406/g.31342  ORF Transcript_18406/g.31342 Transcript_18406/m.31342 type:complete len:223 (+) Transcript_18406:272-940(+)